MDELGLAIHGSIWHSYLAAICSKTILTCGDASTTNVYDESIYDSPELFMYIYKILCRKFLYV